jgi:hypothetical protein
MPRFRAPWLGRAGWGSASRDAFLYSEWDVEGGSDRTVNTAIFTVLNAILLRALPTEDPGRLVLLSNPEYHGIGATVRDSAACTPIPSSGTCWRTIRSFRACWPPTATYGEPISALR